EFELDHGGEPDNDQPEKENHKHLGAIAGILGREVEPAAGAGRAYGQQAGEQPALAAARTAAAERGPGHGNRRETPPLVCHSAVTPGGTRLRRRCAPRNDNAVAVIASPRVGASRRPRT